MSWAEREGIATGVMGEIHKGIPINEENRATNWESYREGISQLKALLQKAYIKKGIRAVLFGVFDGAELPKYAIFVQPGFLRDVSSE